MLQTLKTNWRDFVGFLLIGLAFTVLSDVLLHFTTSENSSLPLGLAGLVNYLQGFSKFVSSNFAAVFIGLAVVWPTLNKFGNESWTVGWDSFSAKEKTIVYISVLMIEAVIAAICFSN